MKTFEINIKFSTAYLGLKYPEFRVFVDTLLPLSKFEITQFSIDLTGSEGSGANITWMSNGTVNYNEMQELVEKMWDTVIEANTSIFNLNILST